jgi:hypothetical protein
MTLGHEQRYLTDFSMERDGAEVAEIRQSTFLERIGGSYEQNATFPFDKAQAKATHSTSSVRQIAHGSKTTLMVVDLDPTKRLTHSHQ